MPRRWYVIQSKSQHEYVAYEHLKDQRFKVFLPQLEEVRVQRNRSFIQSSPLFPTYLFVAFDIKREKWRSIMGTRGVVCLLGSTDEYATPLPKGFVEDLIRQADKRGNIALKKADKVVSNYAPGDRLRVTQGIYKGMSGTCTKIQEEFAVLITALQSGSFEIKLPLGQIAPA